MKKVKYLIVLMICHFFNGGVYAQSSPSFSWGYSAELSPLFQYDYDVPTSSMMVNNNKDVYFAKNLIVDIDNDTLIRSGISLVKVDSTGRQLWFKSLGRRLNTAFIDDSSNIYIMGNYSNDFDADPDSTQHIVPAPCSNGGFFGCATNSFFIKLDPDGHLIWVKTMQANNNTEPSYPIITARQKNGKIYMIISGDSDTDFDFSQNVYTINSNSNLYLLVTDLNLNFIRAFPLFNVNTFYNGLMIDLDSNDNIFIAISPVGEIDFADSNVQDMNISNHSDVLVMKKDSVGNMLWVKDFGGVGTDIMDAFKIDGNDNIILSMLFWKNITINGSTTYNFTANYENDDLLIKMDNTGNVLWGKTFSGNFFERIADLSFDNNNNIYVLGLFDDKADFNPDPQVSEFHTPSGGIGDRDAYVLKLDSLGNFRWVRFIYGKEQQNPFKIIWRSNSLFISGQTFGSTEMGMQQYPVYRMGACNKKYLFINKYED